MELFAGAVFALAFAINVENVRVHASSYSLLIFGFVFGAFRNLLLERHLRNLEGKKRVFYMFYNSVFIIVAGTYSICMFSGTALDYDIWKAIGLNDFLKYLDYSANALVLFQVCAFFFKIGELEIRVARVEK